jgi:type III secretion protein L
MPVIKGEGAAEAAGERSAPGRGRTGSGAQAPRGGAVLDGEVYDAQRAARDILEGAQREADALLAAAREERARLAEEAREAARQEGLAQASEALLRARLEASRLLAGAEREAVALALRVAGRVLGRDLERDPSLVVDVCASALSELRQLRQLVLRVHPADAALLRAEPRRFAEVLGRTADVAFKEDPDVERGGCLVHSESGTLDARLSTQLEMLRRVLLGEEARGEEGPGGEAPGGEGPEAGRGGTGEGGAGGWR